MEPYQSPLNFFNLTGIPERPTWKCDFKPKIPVISSKPEESIDEEKLKHGLPKLNGHVTKLKIHEKGTFRTKNYVVRLPQIHKMLKIMDEDILKELGTPKYVQPVRYANDIAGPESIRKYVENNRAIFYANFSTRNMRNKMESLNTQIVTRSKVLDRMEENIYRDACQFKDFLRETEERYMDESKKLADETSWHNDAKELQHLLKQETSTIKTKLMDTDESLMFLLKLKSFLLLVLYNNKNRSKRMISTEWNAYRGHIVNQLPGLISTRRSTDNLKVKLKLPGPLRLPPHLIPIIQQQSGSKTNIRPKAQKKVLEFLYSIDEITTKLEYPEEWLNNTTFIDQETKQLQPILNNPQWMLGIMDDIKEQCLLFTKTFQSTEQRKQDITAQFVIKKEKLIPELENIRKRSKLIKDQIDVYEAKVAEFQFKSKCVGSMTTEEDTDPAFTRLSKRIEKVYLTTEKDAVQGSLLRLRNPLISMAQIEEACYRYFDIMDLMGDSVYKGLRKAEQVRRKKGIAEKEERELRRRQDALLKSQQRSVAVKVVVVVRRQLKPRSQPPEIKNSKRKANIQEEDLSYYFEE